MVWEYSAKDSDKFKNDLIWSCKNAIFLTNFSFFLRLWIFNPNILEIKLIDKKAFGFYLLFFYKDLIKSFNAFLYEPLFNEVNAKIFNEW